MCARAGTNGEEVCGRGSRKFTLLVEFSVIISLDETNRYIHIMSQVYFEDGTFTRGPIHLSEFVAGQQETVSFEFGIVAPGGRYCTRVTQKVLFHQSDPGSTTAQDESSEPMVTLGGATVSVEEWSGPSRVHTEEKSLRELEKVELLCLRLPQPADDFVGEWRSFNRIATPLGRNPDEDEDEDEDEEREEETRMKFVFEGEVRFHIDCLLCRMKFSDLFFRARAENRAKRATTR